MIRKTPHPLFTDAQLDRALCADRDTILPSSGFVDSVMGAVSAEAAGHSPISFPWKRALPGVAAILAALALFAAATGSMLRWLAANAPAPSYAPRLALPHAELTPAALGVALAALLTFAPLALCARVLAATRSH